MLCSNCLTELRPSFNFCPICGIKFNGLPQSVNLQPEDLNLVPVDDDVNDTGNYPDGFNPSIYDL